jgi:hypothetical protein
MYGNNKPIAHFFGELLMSVIRVTHAEQPRYYPVLARHHRTTITAGVSKLPKPLYMCAAPGVVAITSYWFSYDIIQGARVFNDRNRVGI